MADQNSAFVRKDHVNGRASEADRLKEEVLSWLKTMRVPGGPVGQYRLNYGADATVFSSCFAVFLRHLFGDLDNLDSGEWADWLTWFQGFQDPESGLFVDPENRVRATDRYHDPEHLNRQLTTFCLGAIDALGGQPLFPLHFLDTWKNADNLTRWLDNLDWTNPWNCGNKTMFMGIFLACDWKQTGDPRAKRALDVWFDWHDRHQNPQTGFWGSGPRADYIDGMGGAYHQYVIYNYMNRPIHYADRIIDRVLFLQQPDGMYSPYQGGASCYELDAVDILAHMYLRHEYRRSDICKALQRVLEGILDNQNADGGFCWGHSRPFDLPGYWRLAMDIFRHRSFYYWYLNWRAAAAMLTRRNPQMRTGWARQPRAWSESSIFDTWLRCLTIAEISKVLPDTPYASLDWQFLQVPGLGWFPQ